MLAVFTEKIRDVSVRMSGSVTPHLIFLLLSVLFFFFALPRPRSFVHFLIITCSYSMQVLPAEEEAEEQLDRANGEHEPKVDVAAAADDLADQAEQVSFVCADVSLRSSLSRFSLTSACR